MKDKLDSLFQEIAQIRDIQGASAVLSWDRETYMPSGGGDDRARQMAILERIAHERFTSDKIGMLLADLESADLGAYDSLAASSVRVLRRLYDQQVRIPSDLVVEMVETEGKAIGAWVKAKHDNDFPSFRPHLEKQVELAIKEAEILGFAETPYDALLNKFEPGVTTAQVEQLFSQLKTNVVELVKEITEKGQEISDQILRQSFSSEEQWRVTLKLLETVGFDMNRGRQDRSEHPFTTSFSPNDVRLTTHIYEKNLASAVFSTIHEFGHGMYEQGIPPDLARTPVGFTSSSGVHESQSRLWENIVGRSQEFWVYGLPLLQESFPQQLGQVRLPDFYAAINRVEPSLIRVDADEVTYDLHILIRFELEKRLIEGTLEVKDLPALWGEKYREYLGITPPTDSEGVLQDIHWAGRMFGYFPTYTLGNILASQLYQGVLKDHPSIKTQYQKGDFSTLKKWLNDKVHVHGAKFTLPELAQRVLVEPLRIEPYLEYIRCKYKELYLL